MIETHYTDITTSPKETIVPRTISVDVYFTTAEYYPSSETYDESDIMGFVLKERLSNETLDTGQLDSRSPLGLAVIGCKVGDIASYKSEAGEMHWKILSIEV